MICLFDKEKRLLLHVETVDDPKRVIAAIMAAIHDDAAKKGRIVSPQRPELENPRRSHSSPEKFSPPPVWVLPISDQGVGPEFIAKAIQD